MIPTVLPKLTLIAPGAVASAARPHAAVVGSISYKRNIEWSYGRIPDGRENLWKVRRNYLINCLRMV